MDTQLASRAIIENQTYDEIALGDTASTEGFHGIVGHFMGRASLISAVLSTRLGGRVPNILTNRADSPRTRVASCAVAALLVRSVHR